MALQSAGHRVQRMPGFQPMDPRLFVVPRMDISGGIAQGMEGFDRGRMRLREDEEARRRRMLGDLQLEGAEMEMDQARQAQERDLARREYMSGLLAEAAAGPVDSDTGLPTGEPFEGFLDPSQQRMWENIRETQRRMGLGPDMLPEWSDVQATLQGDQGLVEMDLPGGGRGLYDPANRRMVYTSDAPTTPSAREQLEEQRAEALMAFGLPEKEAQNALAKLEDNEVTDEEFAAASLAEHPDFPGVYINRNRPGEILSTWQDADGNTRIGRIPMSPRGEEREDARPSQKIMVSSDEFYLTPREEGRYREWLIEQEFSGWPDARGIGFPRGRRNDARRAKLNEIIAERSAPTGNMGSAPSRRISPPQGMTRPVRIGADTEPVNVPVVRSQDDLEALDDMEFYWDEDEGTLRQKR